MSSRTGSASTGSFIHKDPTRIADHNIEAGRRDFTSPTLIPQMANVINDKGGTYDFQSSGSEGVKTYRLLPIFPGLLAPFSIMLSIPSLTGQWYIRTEKNVTTEIRPNPLLLDVALGFSMACAVLASAFLLLRFAERCVKHMTLASIAFLTFHGLINVAAVTIFAVMHRVDNGFIFGQSFWFAVCSTFVSTATNITIIIDYVTTKDFATSGSGLTSKQRSLVIIVMVLLSYISLGSFIESKLLDLPFLDALYFSVVTIETIGFGDIYPRSTGARIFTCFYLVGGIMNIALAVTIARDVILESAVIKFKQRLKARHEARRLRSRWRAAIRWRLKERGLPTWIHHHRHGLPEEHPHHQRWFDWLSRMFESFSRFVTLKEDDPAWKLQYGPRQKRLNLEALSDADWNAAALETGAPLSRLVPEELRMRRWDTVERPPGVTLSDRPTIENGEGLQISTSQSLTKFRLDGMLALLSNFAIAVSPVAQPKEPSTVIECHEESDLPLSVHRSGLPLTRSTTTLHENDHHSLEIDEKQMVNANVYLAFFVFILFWLAGSTIFMKTEMWTFWTAAYFCFISFMAVGYGDLTPKSPAGLSIFVVWALLGVATMTILVSVLLEVISQRYQSIIRSEVYHPYSISRPLLSEHPTFGSGTADTYYSRGSTKGNVSSENGSAITIHEHEPVASTEFQALSDSTRYPRSAPIKVDHLKFLIKMAQTECELLNESVHLENLISYLENHF